MSWLASNAAAIQAVAAVVSLVVTALLVWLTSQYVKLTRQLAEGNAKQVELLAKQTEHLRLVELGIRKRHAAALRELCRKIRVSTKHLDPQKPNAPVSKVFSYLRDSDVAAFSARAADVSVEAALSAELVTTALRTVVEQLGRAQTGASWQPTPQEFEDWKAALDVISEDVPKIEKACADVLSSNGQTADVT